jgi:hypothetical protein
MSDVHAKSIYMYGKHVWCFHFYKYRTCHIHVWWDMIFDGNQGLEQVYDTLLISICIFGNK